MSTTTIAAGVKARLATISGLRAYDYLPDAVAFPAAVVGLPTLQDDTAGGGQYALTLTVHVLLGKASDRAAQVALHLYLNPTGTKSVRAAIEGDSSLGGAAKLCRLARSSPANVTIAGVDHLAAVFELEIWF